MYLRILFRRNFGVSTAHWSERTGLGSAPRPFEEIPGPKSLPLIGTLYKYLPHIGEYSFNKLHETGAKKLARYGPLVREEIVPGDPAVWVFKPDDIAELFKSEIGSHPARKSHMALYKYRIDRSNIYNSTGGLLPTNGPEWWRLRKEFQQALSKPQNILHYINSIDNVVKIFVKLCGEKKYNDLLPLISRLFLELTCLIAFDKSMNSFSAEELHKDSKSSKLISAAFTSNSSILRLDNGPRLWRYFDTPLYKKFCSSQQIMEEVALEMVDRKINAMKERPACKTESLLEIYLGNKNLDVKDVVGMACDMLLAGVDTTTYTTAFILYHLGTNPKVQKTLQKEVLTLLPFKETPITPVVLRDASYTKAVIKETFRLNPISVGVGRVLHTDLVLSGYHIPAGTNVITQNQVVCRLPEYFPEPLAFKPERWLRENRSNIKPIHPYLVLPFGHGARSCIARRLAEQDMQILLLRICREYDITWKGGVLDTQSLLINVPDSPIDVEFSPIK